VNEEGRTAPKVERREGLTGRETDTPGPSAVLARLSGLLHKNIATLGSADAAVSCSLLPGVFSRKQINIYTP
jgi:hypothetical protein